MSEALFVAQSAREIEAVDYTACPRNTKLMQWMKILLTLIDFAH